MVNRYTEDRKLWPTNEELYNQTNQIPWSKKISRRRTNFFGHICRLSNDTPVKIALKEAQRKTKKPRGRPRITFLKQMEKQLSVKNIDSIDTAIDIAQDRLMWKIRTED